MDRLSKHNTHHFPAGTAGGRGGQFAPAPTSAVSGIPGEPRSPSGVPLSVAEARAMQKPSTHLINSAARERFRTSLVDRMYGAGAAVKARRADVVMGLPASGKSTVAERLAMQHGSMIVDSDEVKKRLPEFDNGIGAHAVHVESSELITPRWLARSLGNGDNVVLPIVGKTGTGVVALLHNLRNHGYTVNLHFVHLPAKLAIRRAIIRFQEEGRLVSPAYIRSIGHAPRNNFRQIVQDNLPHGHAEYSTDVPRGHPYRVRYEHLTKVRAGGAVDPAGSRARKWRHFFVR